jgi:hypothetical protein
MKKRRQLFPYAETIHSGCRLGALSFTLVCPNIWFLVVQKRCPGCGQNAIPVGSNLRIPAKKDKKGWRQVEAWIEAGADLEAKFVSCATVEQHKQRVAKAVELRTERRIVDGLHPRDRT